EIEVKKMALQGRQDQLQAEKVLLTPELIEDRESELTFFREEIVALQNNYFGPQGRYIQQKNKLLKPIQDQVLSIVRDIARERKYDFVFDRSSDLVMLYSAKNYDISALVLQRLNAQERIKARKKQIEERKAKLEKLKN
ncbi:MAG: OmpH family outer membrane protein, partial [Flavobacteriaceae bacterium]